jgi:MinD-like ATPase involved in chromosome partitioning or flagellar assembly
VSEPEQETTSTPAPEAEDAVAGANDIVEYPEVDDRTDSQLHPSGSGPHEVPGAQPVSQNEVPPVVPPNLYANPQGYPPPPVDQHQQTFPPLGPSRAQPLGQPGPPQSGPPHPGQPGMPQPGQPPVQPPRPGQLPPHGQQPPPSGQRHGRHALAGGDDLTSAHLIKPAKRRPQTGWRKAVFVASGHLVNPGESPAEQLKRELIARVNQPLRGCYKIAMLSLKGGVGKTTTTTTLGSTFASLRGDRVVAVDANPDRGTLSQKIPMETTATVRHLLRDADRITRYSDIRAYTSQGSSRLEILASEQDPAVSEAFSENDYRRAVDLLEHFYNIVLTDCGTGLMHSAMKGVLDLADALVVVSSGSVDGARSASATLDWLDAHGYGDLVKRSVAVINSVRPKMSSVDLDKLEAHFGARTRVVCRIPFDPHLEEGAEIELDRLHEPTRLALLRLAASVADAFPNQ